MNLTYWETVVVGWRILWQGIGGFVLALFLGNLVVVGLLVVRGLINGLFGTFRLVVHRDEPCRSTV